MSPLRNYLDLKRRKIMIFGSKIKSVDFPSNNR